MKAIQTSKGLICIKFYANGLEVSIALDDSCKRALPTEMLRTSLCIFDGEINITEKCFKSKEVNSPSNFDVVKAIKFIENRSYQNENNNRTRSKSNEQLYCERSSQTNN